MSRSLVRRRIRSTLAALAIALVFSPGDLVLLAQENKPPAPPAGEDKKPAQPSKPGEGSQDAAAAEKPATPPDTAKKEPGAEQAPKITNDQLDSLVAPIALYPDSLLAQVLVASTYPLEIVQLNQWLAKNKNLKDKALADAVAKQPWDPSIQSMAALPDVVKRLADDVQWTTDLGNAFLSQQADVMDAAQRMRKKAQDKGALKSNEQQKVTEQKEGDKTVIIVESANPEVVYVPSYSPTVVYGAPVYPYPPIYYPPYPPGAAFVSFSFGVMWGAAIWGGSCCGCGWHGGDVDINVNNNFNKNEINTGGNRGQGGDRGQGTGSRGGASAGTSDRAGGSGGRASAGTSDRGGGAGGGGGGKWSHNPSHRGGTPYSDKATANKYGGNARGDSLSQRQGSGGNRAGGGPSAGTRPSTGAGGAGGFGGGGGASAGTRPSTGAGGSGGLGGSGGGDRIGSRDVGSSGSRGGSSGRGGYSGGGFGSGGGYSGSSARSSASRGSRSMGGRSFGGGGGGGGRRR